ncbi:MAG TPA: hypothetical protein VGM21_12995 [Actinomycetota bacterium]
MDFTLMVAGASQLGPVGLDPHAKPQQPAAAYPLVGLGDPVQPLLDRCLRLLQPALPEPQLRREHRVFPRGLRRASQRPGVVLDQLQVRVGRLELAAADL